MLAAPQERRPKPEPARVRLAINARTLACCSGSSLLQKSAIAAVTR